VSRENPKIKELDERMKQLEAKVTASADKIQNYTRENPLLFVGLALLGGILTGVMINVLRPKKCE
jgi:hypothetical protein